MKKVGIVFGIENEESAVSEETRAEIEKALRSKTEYELIPVHLRDGGFYVDSLRIDVADLDEYIDVAVIAMHGKGAEDGTIQKILEQQHIPCIGSGSYDSAIAFNKAVMKKHALTAGIQTASFVTVERNMRNSNTAQEIFQSLSQPVVIKPATSGSSFGVSFCDSVDTIEKALDEAFRYSETIVAEEYIKGREFAVGVMEDVRGEDLYILPPVEIIPRGGKVLFDTESKYDGTTKEICPAVITEEERDEIETAVKDILSIFKIRHYARVDFVYHPKRGLFLLEINTLPGLSSESLFPRALKVVGLSLGDMLSHYIDDVLK